MKSYWKEIKVAPRKWRYVYVRYARKKPFRGNVKRIKGNQYAMKTSKDIYHLVTKARRI